MSSERPSQKTVQGTLDKDEPEIVESSRIRMLEDWNVERDNMASILEIKIHFTWAELQEISYTVVGLHKVEIYICKY